jgi:hypothetical protein
MSVSSLPVGKFEFRGGRGRVRCDPQGEGQCCADRSIGCLSGARARITAGERCSSTEPTNTGT